MLFQLDVGSQALVLSLSFTVPFSPTSELQLHIFIRYETAETLMTKQEEQHKSVIIDTAQRFTYSPLIFLPEKRILDPLDPDDPELGL